MNCETRKQLERLNNVKDFKVTKKILQGKQKKIIYALYLR